MCCKGVCFGMNRHTCLVAARKQIVRKLRGDQTVGGPRLYVYPNRDSSTRAKKTGAGESRTILSVRVWRETGGAMTLLLIAGTQRNGQRVAAILKPSASEWLIAMQ